jgi:hypothetical protein
VKNLQNERIVLGAQAMGEAAKAIEITLDWVKQRKAFGATLWDKQAIRQRLAMRAVAGRGGARADLPDRVARCAGPAGREGSLDDQVARGTLVNEVMYDCLQFHGGMGYIRESAIERMARDARMQAIGGGATEVLLEEVAKRPAPHYVRSIEVRWAGQPLMSADVDFSISENPSLRFYFVRQGAGELRADVVDNKDLKFHTTLAVKASPASSG